MYCCMLWYGMACYSINNENQMICYAICYHGMKFVCYGKRFNRYAMLYIMFLKNMLELSVLHALP